MKRSGFKPRSTPMARASKPMERGAGLKRGKALKPGKGPGPGKKKLAKDAATLSALLDYFDRFGWEEEPGTLKAPCQMGGPDLTLVKTFNKDGSLKRIHTDANAHHKTPRSELRKAKVLDLDAPYRLLICHHRRHLAFLHGGEMGRHGSADANRRLKLAELHEANAENGLVIGWNAQDALDLSRLG